MKPAKIVLTLTLVGLNLVLGWIVVAIKLPIYLDSIGITVAAILGGPLVAVWVAVATCLLGTVTYSPVLWAFTGTAVLIGLTSSFLASRGFYTEIWKTVLAGLIVAVISALVSAPVAAVVFGGATAGGIDAITLLFKNAGHTLIQSVFFAGLSSEPVDKVITALASVFLIRSLSRRTLAWFPGAEQRIRGDAPR